MMHFGNTDNRDTTQNGTPVESKSIENPIFSYEDFALFCFRADVIGPGNCEKIYWWFSSFINNDKRSLTLSKFLVFCYHEDLCSHYDATQIFEWVADQIEKHAG